MDAETVTAVAASLEAVAVLAALAYAHRQVSEARQSRRDQTRPYVVVYLDFPEERRWFPDLVVANFGTTAAYDIQVTFDPPLRSSLDDEAGRLAEVGFLRTGIRTLVPKQRVATLFDSMIARPHDWEDVYVVRTQYRSASGEELGPETFALDLSAYRDSTFVESKGLEAIYGELSKARKTLDKLASGFQQLHVLTETVSERRERTAAQIAERKARLAEREDKSDNDDTV